MIKETKLDKLYISCGGLPIFRRVVSWFCSTSNFCNCKNSIKIKWREYTRSIWNLKMFWFLELISMFVLWDSSSIGSHSCHSLAQTLMSKHINHFLLFPFSLTRPNPSDIAGDCLREITERAVSPIQRLFSNPCGQRLLLVIHLRCFFFFFDFINFAIWFNLNEVSPWTCHSWLSSCCMRD